MNFRIFCNLSKSRFFYVQAVRKTQFSKITRNSEKYHTYSKNFIFLLFFLKRMNFRIVCNFSKSRFFYVQAVKKRKFSKITKNSKKIYTYSENVRFFIFILSFIFLERMNFKILCNLSKSRVLYVQAVKKTQVF